MYLRRGGRRKDVVMGGREARGKEGKEGSEGEVCG